MHINRRDRLFTIAPKVPGNAGGAAWRCVGFPVARVQAWQDEIGQMLPMGTICQDAKHASLLLVSLLLEPDGERRVFGRTRSRRARRHCRMMSRLTPEERHARNRLVPTGRRAAQSIFILHSFHHRPGGNRNH
jgi:hypothetical protein